MSALNKKRQAMMTLLNQGSPLPEGYTELNYIEATGTQYIDTGIKAKSTLRAVIDAFYGASTTWYALFGSRAGGGNIAFMISSATGGADFYFRYNQVTARPYISITPETRYLIDFDQGNITVNGNLEFELIAAAFNNNANCLLMSVDYNGTINGFTGRVYSCVMYDNGVLVRNFVPCLNPDNEAGLYDLVSGQFYGNDGTGDFLYG